jgi:hypothetical protein
VTSLYAQLESLNTTVAQQRRDAPRRAAKEYAAQLKKTCSVGAVNAAGKGNCGEVESMPLMLIEVEADSKALLPPFRNGQ